MIFENKLYLLLLIIIPIFIYFYMKFQKRKQKSILKFSTLKFINVAQTKKIKNRKNIIFYLELLLLFSIIITLVNPKIELEDFKKGVNVVLAIDNSGSMQATDYSPNRMEAAKLSAKVFIENLEENDYVGIVSFNTGAGTLSYLTPNHKRALEKLSSLTLSNGATAIGDALALSVDMASSIPNKKRIVVLLSDGVSNSGILSIDEAILYAKQNDIQVYTIGMGSNGEVILGYDFFGNPQYSEFDEEGLRKIALETKGNYFKSVNSNTLKEIYKTINEDITREKELKDTWPFFAGLSMLLLITLLVIQFVPKLSVI
ncbi:MAG: VWA domain-containing protein [Candidatus Nanoarchaeia archaeon]|nr:VWA domain-containing protein [Candidatus Nanoarchaeia archaeon]